MNLDILPQVIEALRELQEDYTVPRNVKAKVESIVKTLEDDVDIKIKINKALSELDDITDDTNILPYTRTQLWNISSMLEKI